VRPFDGGGRLDDAPEHDSLEVLIPLLRFHVLGEPIPQGSKSILPAGAKKGGKALLVEGGNRATKHKPANRLKHWRAKVGSAGKLARIQAGVELVDEALVLGLLFVMPRPPSHWNKSGKTLKAKHRERDRLPRSKPDLSKLIRAAEDAMQGMVFVDDSLVVGYREPWKIYDDETPAGLSVEVWTCGS
jgi:Holliday junction resolvase RusA-like endonuclease